MSDPQGITSDPSTAGVDTLYYDGACPLCTREIEQLRRSRGGALALVDIHSLPDTATCANSGNGGNSGNSGKRTDAAPGAIAASGSHAQGTPLPDKDTLLRTLHLRRAGGEWLVAADANVAAWEGTPQERLWRILRAPALRHIVDLGYGLWARWRYRRLYGARGPDSISATHSS